MDSQDFANRFAFRHDVTVETVRDCLERTRRMRLLDCGCALGGLPRALFQAGLDVARIQYFGTDQNRQSVLTARAQYQLGNLGKYQTFCAIVREIEDFDGFEVTPFDVIVMNNILHEIPKETLPRVLRRLNALLVQQHGLLCIVDMEELPCDEPSEPWAITFKLEEVLAILQAGGWSPQGSTHPKRVQTYKVVCRQTQGISQPGLEKELLNVLNRKRKRLLEILDRHRVSQDISSEVQHLSCALTAVTLSVAHLSKPR